MPKRMKPENDKPRIFYNEPKKFMLKMEQARDDLAENDHDKSDTFCQKETSQTMIKPKIIVTSQKRLR